jgi:subtilase family serine protease
MSKTDYVSVVSSDNPDLAARCKEFHSYDFGERIAVKAEVENAGNEKSERFKVALHLSDNGVSLGDLLDVDSVNGGLNPGKSRTLSCKYESPISLSGKYVVVTIDSDDEVHETDETNDKVVARVP